MKYIIDLDSLKECFDLLPNPFVSDGRACVYLDAVKAMIDIFPKEEVDSRNNNPQTADTSTPHWIYNKTYSGNNNLRVDEATCSSCGYEHKMLRSDAMPRHLPDKCPCCGVIMDDEEYSK